MKKPLSKMSDEDAFILFNIHSDFGHYKHPFYHANHDNGWLTTNSFSKHILEADKEKLFEMFDITEDFYNNIENPLVVTSVSIVFWDNFCIDNYSKFKGIKYLKSLGYKNSDFKRGGLNKLIKELTKTRLEFKKPKYKLK